MMTLLCGILDAVGPDDSLFNAMLDALSFSSHLQVKVCMMGHRVIELGLHPNLEHTENRVPKLNLHGLSEDAADMSLCL